MAEWFENLVNKDYLQDNLTFASLFIALYENMTDYVVSSVRDFLCDIGIRDGKMFCEETDEYRREIRKRVVLRLFVGGTLIDMLSFPEVCCDGTKRA